MHVKMVKFQAYEPLKHWYKSQVNLLVIQLAIWCKSLQFLGKPAPVHRFSCSSFNNSAADSWSFASASLICSWEVVFSQKFGDIFISHLERIPLLLFQRSHISSILHRWAVSFLFSTTVCKFWGSFFPFDLPLLIYIFAH